MFKIDRAYKENSDAQFYVDSLEKLSTSEQVCFFRLKKYTSKGGLKKTEVLKRGVEK